METQKQKKLRHEITNQLLNLITAGFGLVAALAWNQAIQMLIATYIQPLFGKKGSLSSTVIYAVFVTLLAVIVTFYLSKFLKKN
jgi:hypothetical protein